MSLQHYYNQFEQEREKVTITFVDPLQSRMQSPSAVINTTQRALRHRCKGMEVVGGEYGEVAFTSQQHLSKKKKKSTVTRGVHAELSTHA